ncbi:hypothetical protein TNCV_831231 [Trichonephila clavipes]|nr:hypothetical protein TNCV_831231 [Trichonephila clavipes]
MSDRSKQKNVSPHREKGSTSEKETRANSVSRVNWAGAELNWSTARRHNNPSSSMQKEEKEIEPRKSHAHRGGQAVILSFPRLLTFPKRVHSRSYGRSAVLKINKENFAVISTT